MVIKADDLVKDLEFTDEEDEKGKEVIRGYTNFEKLSKEVEHLKQIVNLCVKALDDNEIRLKEGIPFFTDEDVNNALELENKD